MERGDERQESLPDEARDKTDELPECLADETVDGAGSSARPTRSYAKVLTTLENLGVAEEKLQSLSYADAVRLLDEMQAEGRLAKPQISEVQKMKSVLTLATVADSIGVCDPKFTLTDEARLKERIILHLEGKATRSQSALELLDEVREKALNFRGSCNTLLALSSEVDTFIRSAMSDRHMKPYLLRELIRYEERMQSTEALLRDGVCPLIVTGEVAAGKSSFLNILCQGENFSLPSDEQVTTSCICELRHGDERKAIVHRADPRDGEEEEFEIKLEDLDKYVNFEKAVQNDKIPYKKVDIYFPSKLLKSGLVFIDTPGVGSDRFSMTEFVENYLQDSVGFIYVINDAINVHKLCRLFDIEACTTDAYLINDVEDLSGIRRRRTIFILNKWDQVVKKQDMLDAVQKKLQEHWLTKSGDQAQPFVHPFASTVDLEHLQAGYVSDRLHDVIERIKEVAPHNMKLILQSRFKWLQFVTSRVEYHANRYLSHADATENNIMSKVRREAEENLETARNTGKQCKEDMSTFCKTVDLSEAVNHLRQYLKEATVRSRINTWGEAECPGTEVELPMVQIESAAKQVVSNRIQTVLHSWEDKFHYTVKVKMSLGEFMKKRLENLQLDVATVSGALTATRPLEQTIPEFPFNFILNSDRGIVKKKVRMFLVRNIFYFRKKEYEGNRVACMTDMSNEALSCLNDEQNLTNLLRNLVGLTEVQAKFVKYVDEFIEQFSDEVSDLKKNEKVTGLKERYEPIGRKCQALQEELLRWELGNIFEGLQVRNEDVRHPAGECQLGYNYFADFVRGEVVSVAEKPQPVLIKKYKGEAADDIRFIMREYQKMRDTECTAIAKAQGMIVVDQGLSLVMEPAVSSLDTWLHEQKNVPKYNSDIFSSQTLSFAFDIASGLVEIHRLHLVHRNLTPTCIMVISEDDDHNKCKLYDIGDLRQTPVFCSVNYRTDRHTAPELKTQTAFNHPMDIYSFGQVLRDLWEGTVTQDASTDTLSQRKDGNRMPPRYEELVLACTDPKSRKRPSAKIVQCTITSIAQSFEGVSSVDVVHSDEA